MRPLVNGEFQAEQNICLLCNCESGQKSEVKQEINAKGLLALPTLYALGVDFREPNRDDVYSFADGFEAMKRGGFTSALYESAANPIDDLPKLRSIRQICNKKFNISFLASLSVENLHKNISEMLELSNGGAFGFGDGSHPVGNLRFLRMALEYGNITGKTFYLHPLEPNLAQAGTVHEGVYSDTMGFKGIPEQAETIAVYQILELSKWFDTPVHLREISCAWSLSLIAQAKKQGVKVSCDVGIYHLLFDDSSLTSLSSEFRFNSPLRTAKDRERLWKGLLNGTIDKISVNHFPVRPQDKQTNFEDSVAGSVSLEIALSALWQEAANQTEGHPEKIFEWLGDEPKKQMGIDDANKNLILFDPECEWTVTEKTFAGAVCNTPLLNKTLKGKIVGTYINSVWNKVD